MTADPKERRIRQGLGGGSPAAERARDVVRCHGGGELRPDPHALAEEAVKEHGADQRASELAVLGQLALNASVSSVLEIGTFKGGTAWYFAQLQMQVTTVDRDMSKLLERVVGVRYQNSYSGDVAAATADLVFIDGDHSYEGVRQDYLKLLPCAQKLLAIHDIALHPPETGCEVHRFWRELVEDGSHCLEIIHPGDGIPWAGIGVIER